MVRGEGRESGGEVDSKTIVGFRRSGLLRNVFPKRGRGFIRCVGVELPIVRYKRQWVYNRMSVAKTSSKANSCCSAHSGSVGGPMAKASAAFKHFLRYSRSLLSLTSTPFIAQVCTCHDLTSSFLSSVHN